MIQFYFLSVALNIACGLALILPNRPHPRQLLRHFDVVLSDSGVRISLGSLGIVVGALTLISPIQGDVPFVGDLIPALSSALAGLVLLLEIRSERKEEPTRQGETADGSGQGQGSAQALPLSDERLRRLLVESGRIIGFIAILAGIVHFLFPLELFL
ncbi:MAG TPA: hypothetical protein VMV83_07435 [Rectinemataceae bacterium]|nr:hypothetical protein [Rectinemataceae bacterium]